MQRSLIIRVEGLGECFIFHPYPSSGKKVSSARLDALKRSLLFSIATKAICLRE